MKKTERRIGFWLFLVCFTFLGTLEAVPVTIRVVAYNTYNNPDDAIEDAWFSTIFSAMEILNLFFNRPMTLFTILRFSFSETIPCRCS